LCDRAREGNLKKKAAAASLHLSGSVMMTHISLFLSSVSILFRFLCVCVMMMRPCGKQHASPPLANLPATFDSTHGDFLRHDAQSPPCSKKKRLFLFSTNKSIIKE
jgi:hypothetical protein